MKNFLLLFSVITLFTFTQCCPDKTAHEKAVDLSHNFFKGTVTLLAEGNNDIGLILIDFGNDQMV